MKTEKEIRDLKELMEKGADALEKEGYGFINVNYETSQWINCLNWVLEDDKEEEKDE